MPKGMKKGGKKSKSASGIKTLFTNRVYGGKR